MNTAVLKASGQLVMENRACPQPAADEVIIDVAYCGVCRTDRKSYRRGQRDLHLPRVLGHEFSGIISGVGSDVKNYDVGEPVAVFPGIGCGHCPDCLNGNEQRCREMKIFGFHLDGGFSRYCRIPGSGVAAGVVKKLSSPDDLKAAAMCEPVACALHMLSMFTLNSDDTVLIVGAGVLGRFMAALIKISGIEKILIIEPNEKKRNDCRKKGFRALCSAKELSVYAPDGVNVVIPCCPGSEPFCYGLEALKNGGFFGYFSGLTGAQSLTEDLLNLIHYKELTVKGAYGCGIKDYEAALRYLKEQPSLFDTSMITLISLADVEETLKQTETEDALVTMICYKGEAL